MTTTTQDTETIADLLRQRRGDDPQTKAAREIGVSRQIYGAWESGHFTPGDEWAEPIAIYLGLELAEVVLRLFNDRARKRDDSRLLDITWKDGELPWFVRPMEAYADAA